MKHKVLAALLAVAALTLAPVAEAAEVGVSVRISQPGVYGRIDIGRFPQPQLVLPQPVLIARPVVVQAAPPQPVYMWVPPGHRKDWRKYCHTYQACGVPVYFVQHWWYEQNVRPHGKDHDRGHDKGRDKEPGKGHGKGKHGD